MRHFTSQAERYRHHRQCFELALRMGVTPREAEIELDRRNIRTRTEKAMERYRREEAIARAVQNSSISSESWDAPWMMRE